MEVKVDLLDLSVSAGVASVKAGAFAPPLTRLAALTLSPPAELWPSSERRRRLNSDMAGLPAPGYAVAQDRIEDGQQAVQRLIDEISVQGPCVAPARAGAGNILGEAVGNKIT